MGHYFPTGSGSGSKTLIMSINAAGIPTTATKYYLLAGVCAARDWFGARVAARGTSPGPGGADRPSVN